MGHYSSQTSIYNSILRVAYEHGKRRRKITNHEDLLHDHFGACVMSSSKKFHTFFNIEDVDANALQVPTNLIQMQTVPIPMVHLNAIANPWAAEHGGHGGTVSPHFCKKQKNCPFFNGCVPFLTQNDAIIYNYSQVK